MNKFKEFQDLFFLHIKKIFALTSGRSEEEINDILVNLAESEEQRKVIQDICEEIDTEHILMTEVINSGEDAGEWLENKIELITKELYPNATPEEIEMVKQKVEEGMEKDIENGADALNEEMPL